MTTREDRDRVIRQAADLARRPAPTGPLRREIDRITGAAEILARQLQQRATSSRRRSR